MKFNFFEHLDGSQMRFLLVVCSVGDAFSGLCGHLVVSCEFLFYEGS